MHIYIDIDTDVKQINSIFDLPFYYYLDSYTTTNLLHSSDKMTRAIEKVKKKLSLRGNV